MNKIRILYLLIGINVEVNVIFEIGITGETEQLIYYVLSYSGFIRRRVFCPFTI
jgi:hypothetical protein